MEQVPFGVRFGVRGLQAVLYPAIKSGMDAMISAGRRMKMDSMEKGNCPLAAG